jgi:hypothetical protein
VLTTATGAGQRGGREGAAGVASAAHTPAHSIRIEVASDGSFVVVNTRTGFRKTYRSRD